MLKLFYNVEKSKIAELTLAAWICTSKVTQANEHANVLGGHNPQPSPHPPPPLKKFN